MPKNQPTDEENEELLTEMLSIVSSYFSSDMLITLIVAEPGEGEALSISTNASTVGVQQILLDALKFLIDKQ